MPATVSVAIHASQFPENVRQDLLHSLRTRSVNHKFHYDSVKQAQQWLALHQAHSPSRTDPDCTAAYERGFAAMAAVCAQARQIHVIGLGCGGGQKDTRLLRLLQRPDRPSTTYTPCDVSTALVLIAHQAALEVLPARDCSPLVCDLLQADDLGELFEASISPEAVRIVTFFGMIPNFEPHTILPRLADLLHPGDHLLLSANLSPGGDYLEGIRRILPLYDNELTRAWLMTFLLDLGVERSDGELRFVIEDGPGGDGLKRIAAYFGFIQRRSIEVGDARFAFHAGESIRLFFSYRHTPDRIRGLLRSHGMAVVEQWIIPSGEEGVFLCHRL